MNTKKCTCCGEEKLDYEFYKKTGCKNGVDSTCKKCQIKKSYQWKKDNPENLKQQQVRQFEKRMARKKELQEWVNNKKLEIGCSICGYKEFAECLQYHHIDKGNKKNTISTLLSSFYTKERIQEEIDKCIVLCANCHAILHDKD